MPNLKHLAVALVLVLAASASAQTGTTAVKFTDEDGATYGVKQIDGKPRVSAQSYLYDIAECKVPGHFGLHKFGYNPDVDVANSETISTGGGIVPRLAAAEVLQVSAGAADVGTLVTSGTADSGSTALILVDAAATFVTDSVAAGDAVVDDTSDLSGIIESVDSETQLTLYGAMKSSPCADTVSMASGAYRVVTSGGTGAGLVRLLGLDSDYEPLADHVILNGAADVATASSFLRTHRAYVILAGSAGVNSAAVDIQNNAASTTLIEIRAGINQTETTAWTVPAGMTLFVTGTFSGETNNKRVSVVLYHRPLGGTFRPTGFAMAVKQSDAPILYKLPLAIGEKTDIELRGFADTDDGAVTGGIEGWYE